MEEENGENVEKEIGLVETGVHRKRYVFRIGEELGGRVDLSSEAWNIARNVGAQIKDWKRVYRSFDATVGNTYDAMRQGYLDKDVFDSTEVELRNYRLICYEDSSLSRIVPLYGSEGNQEGEDFLNYLIDHGQMYRGGCMYEGAKNLAALLCLSSDWEDYQDRGTFEVLTHSPNLDAFTLYLLGKNNLREIGGPLKYCEPLEIQLDHSNGVLLESKFIFRGDECAFDVKRFVEGFY